MKRYKTADEFFEAQTEHAAVLNKLRSIILETKLEETVKWGGPVYTVGGKNVVGIGAFKSYFGLWFFQGVFLKDPAGVLVNAQEGTTKAMRQWRMQSPRDIDKPLILKYLKEAIENAKAGKAIKPEKKPLVIPPELKRAFSGDIELRDAFEAFSLSCKREFAEYVAGAKREETRANRLAKIVPMIKARVGLNDKYR